MHALEVRAELRTSSCPFTNQIEERDTRELKPIRVIFGDAASEQYKYSSRIHSDCGSGFRLLDNEYQMSAKLGSDQSVD